MRARHLTFDQYRTMPWKNGGGVTHEIAVGPEGQDLSGDFLWRLSVAEVGSSGPFSSFPGIDRTLTVLSGNGLRLDFGEGEALVIDVPWQPASFDGARACEGRLIGGPVTDFNVMTRRGPAKHRVRCVKLGDDALSELLETEVTALLSLRGNIVVRCGQTSAALGQHDTFLVERDGGERATWIIEGDARAMALLVEIDLSVR